MQSNSGKMVCENCLTEDEEDDGFGDMLLELAGE